MFSIQLRLLRTIFAAVQEQWLQWGHSSGRNSYHRTNCYSTHHFYSTNCYGTDQFWCANGSRTNPLLSSCVPSVCSEWSQQPPSKSVKIGQIFPEDTPDRGVDRRYTPVHAVSYQLCQMSIVTLKLSKQDNVQANPESVQCRVFQIHKVFDHQHRHFGVSMHFLTVYQAHILYTLWYTKMTVLVVKYFMYLKHAALNRLRVRLNVILLYYSFTVFFSCIIIVCFYL